MTTLIYLLEAEKNLIYDILTRPETVELEDLEDIQLEIKKECDRHKAEKEIEEIVCFSLPKKFIH